MGYRAMTTMSQRKNEVIMIGDDVSVVVVEIRGDMVRLGIEVPSGTPVHRGEVYDAILQNEHSESPPSDSPSPDISE